MIKKILIFTLFSSFVSAQSLLDRQQLLKEEIGSYIQQGNLEGVVKKIIEAKSSGIEPAILKEILAKAITSERIDNISASNKGLLTDLISLLEDIEIDSGIIESIKAKLSHEDHARESNVSSEEQATEDTQDKPDEVLEEITEEEDGRDKDSSDEEAPCLYSDDKELQAILENSVFSGKGTSLYAKGLGITIFALAITAYILHYSDNTSKRSRAWKLWDHYFKIRKKQNKAMQSGDSWNSYNHFDPLF